MDYIMGLVYLREFDPYNTDNGPAIFRLDDHIRRLFNSGKAYFMHFEYTLDEIKQCYSDTS